MNPSAPPKKPTVVVIAGPNGAGKSTRAMSEQDRIDLALKQAAAHARKQLATQGLKLPTQSWKTGKISNPVV